MQDLPNPAQKFLSIGKAAKTFGVSIDTLRRWDAAGKIKVIRTPGGTRLVPISEIEKVIQKETQLPITTGHVSEQPVVSIQTPKRIQLVPPTSLPTPPPVDISTLKPHQKIIHHIKQTRPGWYHRYHRQGWVSTLHTVLMVAFFIVVGSLFLYTEVIRPGLEQTQDNLSKQLGDVLAATSPPSVLSFQGRVTNSSGVPISTSTKFVFRIYTAETGGTLKWTSKDWTLTPDQNGIFSVCLGNQTTTDDCLVDGVADTPIPSDLFTDNAALYLEIDVHNPPAAGGETLSPRQRIASVSYALNSDALEGFHGSQSPGADQVPILNGSGNLAFGAAASITTGSGDLTINSAGNFVSSDNIDFNGSGTNDIAGTLNLSGNNLTSTAGLTINSGGSVDIQDAVTVDSLTTDTGGVSIAANQSYTGVGAVTLSSATDTDLTIDAQGTGNIVLPGFGATCTALETNVSNQLVCGTDDGATDLQTAYNSSTSPEIVLDATRGALTIRDNATPIGANLLEVQNNAGGTTYFGVSSSGLGTSGDIILSGGDISGGGANAPWIDLGEAAAGAINFSAGSTTAGDFIFNVDSDSIVSVTGGADGTDAFNIAAGNLTLTDGDLVVSGGDANFTLDATDIFNVAKTSGTGADTVNIATTSTADSAADTYNGLSISWTESADADIFNAVSIGNTTSTNSTTAALTIGTGWDNIISSANFSVTGAGAITDATGITSSGTITFSSYDTDANAVLYTHPTGGVVTRVVETETGSQCLLSGAGASGIPVWGSCSGASSPFTTTTGVISQTIATDQLNLVMGETGDYGLKVGTSVAPTVDLVQIINGNASATNSVDGLAINFTSSNASGAALHITPSFSSTTTALTYNVFEVDAFSPTNSTGTDTVNGLTFGNLTDPGASITSTTINIGTGWDSQINANGFDVSGIGATSINTGAAAAAALLITSGANVNSIGITSNSVDAAAVINVTSSGITTGTVFNANAINALTTGNFIRANGNNTYIHTASETGSLVDLKYIDSTSANSALTTITNGVSIASTVSITGGASSSGTKTINGINVASPTLTSCSGGTNTCVWNGLQLPTLSPTSTIAVTSLNIPNSSATAPASSTLIGINVGNITGAGAGTETAINIGTGWDNIISNTSFSVTGAGAVTAIGVNSGAGLLQGALGLTITGAAVSLNASSNFDTNINTGTSTGTVIIGNSASTNIKLGKFTTANGVLYVSATDGTVAETAASSAAQCLQTAGAGTAPIWGGCGAGGFSGEVDDTTNDALTFTSDDASPPSGVRSIYAADTNDLVINAKTGGTVDININDSGEFSFSADGLTVSEDNWIGIGAAAERIVFDGTGDDIEFLGADVGLGTADPLLNFGSASGDFASHVGLHIDGTTNTGIIAVEGDTGGKLALADSGGGVNDKIIELEVDGGLAAFRSLNDDLTTLTDNILTMDLGNGNIGAGTTPGEEFTIYRASGYVDFRMQSGANDIVDWGVSSNGGYVYSYVPGGPLYFGTSGTEQMRIQSDGKVGIKTNTPAMSLEINHATGQNLRLTYNDSDGGATSYTDFTLATDGDLTINSSGGSVDIQDALNADSITSDAGVSIATGNNYTGSGTVTLSSAAASSLTINSGTTGGLNIGDDGSAEIINIGTGAAGKTITLGNVTGATAVNINTGTGGSTLTTTGAGDFTVASGDDVVINGAGASAAISIGTAAVAHTIIIGSETNASSLELDSGTGAISIGNAIAKTINIGNATGATLVNIDSGTGGVTIDSTSTGDILLNSTDTILLDSAGVLELNSSGGVISIGNDAIAQNINVGTGAAARTITIGNTNTTTSLTLTKGASGNITFTGFASCTALETNGSGQLVCGADDQGGSGFPDTATFTDSTVSNPVSFTSAAEIFNDTAPNIVADSTSSTVLVSVTINGTGDDNFDAGGVFEIRRVVNGNPGCSDTQVGTDFAGSFHTSNGEDWLATAVFLDSPGAADTINYTVCTDAGGTDDGNVANITVVLTELGADLAENYYTKDDSIVAGHIVSIDETLPAGAKKSANLYDSQMLGVVSTAPGWTLDDAIGLGFGRSVPVALVGRVPVKVNGENGPINVGDLITSSSTPGVGMRATRAGYVIGRALTAFSGDPSTGSGQEGVVLAFVNTHYANPTVLTGSGELIDSQPNEATSSANLATNSADLITLDSKNNLVATISAGTKFVWENSLGKAVAWISDAGEAFFQKVTALVGDFQKLVFGELAVKKDAQTAGEASFAANETEVFVESDKVTEGSLINLTASTKTGGLSLYIKEKKVGEGFVVALERNSGDLPDEATASATLQIKFNWFIINQQ